MAEAVLQGVGVSEGIAMGTAYRYESPRLVITERAPESPEVEHRRFLTARTAALAQLGEHADRQSEAGEILAAHRALLNDPMLEEMVRTSLQRGCIIETAVNEAVHELAALLRAADDPLFAARAADIEDVGTRLLRILTGAPPIAEVPRGRFILVALDLSPSETAALDASRVLGICLSGGGATSHTAILARSLGIPAVVALGEGALSGVRSGDSIVIDADGGLVILDPSIETHERFQQRHEREQQRRMVFAQYAKAPGQTADGTQISVLANIGTLETAHKAVEDGAQGVGLLRTEFLYMDTATPPSEDVQVIAYRGIFSVMRPCPVVVRTFDLGGDKPIPFINFPAEPNPFLGWRGVRVSLERPALFRTQLRALLRAAVGHDVSLMFPLVESVETMRRAQAVLAEVRAELDAAGVPYQRALRVGVMVETPSAVMMADALARECDFLSLGTNDLAAYALAADRAGEGVTSYYVPFSPPVLRLIRHAVEAAQAAGKPISVCGELASDPFAIPILLGFGVRHFSVVSARIPLVKWLVRQFTIADAQRIASEAAALTTQDALRGYMQNVFREYDIMRLIS